jgi:hypothetical protein
LIVLAAHRRCKAMQDQSWMTVLSRVNFDIDLAKDNEAR